MISALTTGHEGSLSTLHASSPAEAMRRLVTLALMGDLELPWRAVADQVASAVDLVVHQARDASGARRTVEVSEVVRGPDGPVTLRLCRWRRSPSGGGFVWSPRASAWRTTARITRSVRAATRGAAEPPESLLSR